jgi:hypothetical protein
MRVTGQPSAPDAISSSRVGDVRPPDPRGLAETLFDELENLTHRWCEAAFETREPRLSLVAPSLCLAAAAKSGTVIHSLPERAFHAEATTLLRERCNDGTTAAVMLFSHRRAWRAGAVTNEPTGVRPAELPRCPLYDLNRPDDLRLLARALMIACFACS